jgi:hypothetical protein
VKLKKTIFLILWTLPLFAKANNGDWQLWNDYSWNQNLGNALTINVRSEFRFEQNMSSFDYFEVEPGLTFRYSPRWDFFVAYERDERLRPDRNVVNVPNLGAVLKLPIKNWSITNRSRMDFSLPEEKDQSSDSIYRNLLNISHPWKLGGKELNISFFNEFFLSSSAFEITENRTGVALDIPLANHWMCQFFGMRDDIQIDSEGSWEWHPVLGIQIQTQF